MRRIYTRTGDKGMTGIHGGERIPKDDIRIEANGCIDELNAVIGIIRSLLPQEHEWQSLLFTIQKNIMVVMSHVSDLFFVMARYEMQQQNWTEEKWQSFAYKRKKKE